MYVDSYAVMITRQGRGKTEDRLQEREIERWRERERERERDRERV